MQMTRRELATAVLVSAPALPQTTSDDLVKTARGRIQSNAAELAKVDVPMDVEPAFMFKA